MKQFRPTSIELFCGAGGMTLGFEQAGFDVLAAFDLESFNVATHQKNFPGTLAFPVDLSCETGDSLRKLANLNRTEIDVVFGGLSLAEHLSECRRVLEHQTALPGELFSGDPFVEGAARQVLVNRYERDSAARRLCIAHYGPVCVVCGLSFSDVYGPLAEGFIHVHHLKPLAEIGAMYVVDPVADLRPVCPNCHAVIHVGGVTRSVEEVRQLLVQRRSAEPGAAPDPAA